MSCEHYRELASAALDGELARDELNELGAHLEACADCRRFAEDLDLMHDLALSAPPLRLPRSRQHEILRRTVGGTSLRSRLRRWFAGPSHGPRTLAWAGSLAVLILLGSVAIRSVWREAGIADHPAGRTETARPVQRVEISESDVVATSSTLKILFTDQDVVKSTTMVLSGDRI